MPSHNCVASTDCQNNKRSTGAPPLSQTLMVNTTHSQPLFHGVCSNHSTSIPTHSLFRLMKHASEKPHWRHGCDCGVQSIGVKGHTDHKVESGFTRVWCHQSITITFGQHKTTTHTGAKPLSVTLVTNTMVTLLVSWCDHSCFHQSLNKSLVSTLTKPNTQQQ